jgi:predicted O-methyltransferase YrrM
LHSLLSTLLLAGARSRPGRRLLTHVLLHDPALGLGPLGWALARQASFDTVTWPERLSDFEDVTFLLSSNEANRGIASMTLEEAAYLWRCVRAARDGTFVEIGRERGGSTLLIAAAMSSGSTLVSYDPQSKLGLDDAPLLGALRRFGLEGRVDVRLEDSHLASPPATDPALVLVDGDPSLEGTTLDVDRFCRRLRRDGRALLHDAAPGGSRHETLKPLLARLDRDPGFARLPDVGSFVTYRAR